MPLKTSDRVKIRRACRSRLLHYADRTGRVFDIWPGTPFMSVLWDGLKTRQLWARCYLTKVRDG